jgi:leader peptidase (prepilin peptidase)/N-methyltransferase
MEPVFYLLVFVFGAIIGSFLNVVILRHKTGITLFGRSFCFSCNKQLHVGDLIPMFSFLFLRGKCRFCKSKISRQYIAVEAMTGVLFALIFWSLGGTVSVMESFNHPMGLLVYLSHFVFFAAAFSLLVVIAAYDSKHKIIPDIFSYGFSALAFIRVAFLPETFSFVPTVWDFLAGPILALPLFLLWYFSKGRGIGLGDAKLMLGLGWFLGLKAGFASLVLSFWIGAAVGLLLIAFQKFGRNGLFRCEINRKTEIPFAPFLITSFFMAVFFPEIADSVYNLFF